MSGISNGQARLAYARIRALTRAAFAPGSLISVTMGYALLEISSRIIQAASIFILAYWFEKAEFGQFYAYLAVYQLITVLGTGGLLESFMRRLSRPEQEQLGKQRLVVSYLVAYLRRSLLTSVAFFIVTKVGYGGITREPIDGWILCASLVAGTMYGLVTLIGGYMTCSGANRTSILLRSLYISLSYTLAVAVAILSHRILFFFWGLGAAAAVTIALVAWTARDAYPSMFATVGRRPASDGSAWFLIPALLNWFFWYGLVVCVSRYLGAERAAELAFVNNIASLLFIINTAISQAWVSRYLQQVTRSRRSAEARSRFVFRLQSFLMLAVAVSVAAGYGLLRAFGAPVFVKYGDLGLPICVLLFAISISSTYFSAINSFAINNQGKRLALISLLAYAVSIAVLVAIAGIWGMLGVYVGLGLLIVSRGYIITFYAIRYLGAGFFDFRLFAANLAAFTAFAAYYAR